MIELEGDARDEQGGAEQGKSKGKAMLHAWECSMGLLILRFIVSTHDSSTIPEAQLVHVGDGSVQNGGLTDLSEVSEIKTAVVDES